MMNAQGLATRRHRHTGTQTQRETGIPELYAFRARAENKKSKHIGSHLGSGARGFRSLRALAAWARLFGASEGCLSVCALVAIGQLIDNYLTTI